MAKRPPTAVDLFAGCGGFTRGFVDAGFRVTHAVENFRHSAASYRANFPDVLLIEEAIQRVRTIPAEPDVVFGGPPCEAYTAANADRRPRPEDRLFKDKSGMLVLDFVRLVRLLRPRAFVMENVVGILDEPLPAILTKEFQAAGFPKVVFNVLNAEEHGAPSRRTRVFVSNLEIAPPLVLRRPTVWETIGDLAEPDAGPAVDDYDPPRLSRNMMAAVRRLKPGTARIEYEAADGRRGRNWIRLHPQRLGPTVLGNSRFVHPVADRLLSVREHARLMGFPDSHVFAGGRDRRYEMVGEAVPPPLGKAVAVEVRKALA
ncbi:MAG: DNA cytosine methyltransferase [Methanobacteriota archaeon]